MNTKFKLSACRVNASLTQKNVAEKLGVSLKTICNWESGKTTPPFDKVQKMAELYQVSIDNIFLQ